MRQCVPKVEVQRILSLCHDSPYEGNFTGQRTAAKVLQRGYFFITLFKDAREFVKCERCQRTGNILARNEMPFTSILEIELFDIWASIL